MALSETDDILHARGVRDALRKNPPEDQKCEAALAMTVRSRLKAARDMNGLNQVQAAQRMGYANSTQISLAESGNRVPPLGMLIRYAEVYAVPIDYLVGLSDEPDRDPRMAARTAAMSAARSIVDSAVASITDHVERNLASSSLHQEVISELAQLLEELVDAYTNMRRLSGDDFDDILGGSRLDKAIRLCQSVIPRVEEAKRGTAVSVVRDACRTQSDDLRPMIRELMLAIKSGDDLRDLASLGGRAMAISRSRSKAVQESAQRLADRLQTSFPGWDEDAKEDIKHD